MKQLFDLHTAYAGKTEAFPCSDVILHPQGRACQQKNEHSEALSCVQLHFNALHGILMLHFFVTLKM